MLCELFSAGCCIFSIFKLHASDFSPCSNGIDEDCCIDYRAELTKHSNQVDAGYNFGRLLTIKVADAIE
jgi:hypothetical protein